MKLTCITISSGSLLKSIMSGLPSDKEGAYLRMLGKWLDR